MATHYSNLAQMLGGYFNQDWRVEYRDVEEATRAFVAGNASQVKAALSELKQLAQKHSGAALAAELEKLGGAAHGKGPDTFVATVERVLEKAVKRHGHR